MANGETRKPNVLWIGVDQLRYDTPGCNGNTVCQTPQIDRLAGAGVSFDAAYTPSSLCTPARASMLTGRFAFTHGMGTNCGLYHSLAAEVPDPEMLLHYRLMRQGYRCGFVGKWHVGTEKGPADYGFEGMNITGYGNIRQDPGFLAYLERNGLRYEIREPMFANAGGNTLLGGLWDGPAASTPAHYLAESTLEMLDGYADSDQPFFLTCQFWGPHMPHLPSCEFAGLHDRQAIQPWPNFHEDGGDKPIFLRRVREDFYRQGPYTWDRCREMVGLYYDFTTMIDAEIGRILAHLEALGLADSTIVVLTTDHGDMTGSHGGLLDKGYMYEEAHHIPLIVAWQGQFSRGARSDELVYNMDIFPTLLDLLGLSQEADDGLDGRSFLPCLCGRPHGRPREELLLEFHGIRYLYSQRALRTRDGWKYIFTPGDRDECYDLNTDPAERNNRIDDPACAEKVRELRERLKHAASAAGDPIQDCIWKYFGDWDTPSDQFDCSRL